MNEIAKCIENTMRAAENYMNQDRNETARRYCEMAAEMTEVHPEYTDKINKLRQRIDDNERRN